MKIFKKTHSIAWLFAMLLSGSSVSADTGSYPYKTSAMVKKRRR